MEKKKEKSRELQNICSRYMNESLIVQLYFNESLKRFLNDEEFLKLERSVIECDKILYELAQCYYTNRDIFVDEELGYPEYGTLEERIKMTLEGGYRTSKNFQEIKRIRVELLKEMA
jgi:flagellar biosynthesis regulator FlbT